MPSWVRSAKKQFTISTKQSNIWLEELFQNTCIYHFMIIKILNFCCTMYLSRSKNLLAILIAFQKIRFTLMSDTYVMLIYLTRIYNIQQNKKKTDYHSYSQKCLLNSRVLRNVSSLVILMETNESLNTYKIVVSISRQFYILAIP